jgi:aryl-alcohol dehydrogenase-like predicted oxidoreductase
MLELIRHSITLHKNPEYLQDTRHTEGGFMLYRQIGNSDISVSVLGLGGHEFLPNGKSRGFNEDAKKAVSPGYLFDGFGGEKRKRVLSAAFANGINLLDATIDSEKEALGRNLKEITPPFDVYIQTRPEGMVYTYDPFNQRMARYDLLNAEVQRGLVLLQRQKLDFLNVAFMAEAIIHDPDYLIKITDNVMRLKEEGLIRFACADTFSGETTYLQQIKTGCFDAIFINLNFADSCGCRKVLPAANARGMAVFAREAFMKGALFQMGEDVGLLNRNQLAQAALKWTLSQPEVTAVMVGVETPEQLENSLQVLEDLALNDNDQAIIAQLKSSPTYSVYAKQKAQQFGCELD